jgi:hypothetical protein
MRVCVFFFPLFYYLLFYSGLFHVVLNMCVTVHMCVRACLRSRVCMYVSGLKNERMIETVQMFITVYQVQDFTGIR